jgi:hypothetical protein
MSYRALPSFVSDPLSRSEDKIIDCVVGKCKYIVKIANGYL